MYVYIHISVELSLDSDFDMDQAVEVVEDVFEARIEQYTGGSGLDSGAWHASASSAARRLSRCRRSSRPSATRTCRTQRPSGSRSRTGRQRLTRARRAGPSFSWLMRSISQLSSRSRLYAPRSAPRSMARRGLQWSSSLAHACCCGLTHGCDSRSEAEGRRAPGQGVGEVEPSPGQFGSVLCF